MPVQIGTKSHSFSDPTGLLSDCHRWIEMFLGTLERIAPAIDRPLTEDIRPALESALRYFPHSGIFPTQLGIWSYGAQVAQPVFTGGALRGNLHLAESEHSQALIAYQQTIQRAFGDVSDALIGYDKFHQVRVRQQDTVADLQETVRISTLRYQGGTTTYLEVLDSQRSLYTAELTLASARGDEFRSLVQLYRALGGGWQQ